MLASLLEVTHMHYVAFIRANSKNPSHIEPLQVPRPYATDEPADTGRLATHAEMLRVAEGGAL